MYCDLLDLNWEYRKLKAIQRKFESKNQLIMVKKMHFSNSFEILYLFKEINGLESVK